MSTPDPYASPPRDREAGGGEPSAWSTPGPPWGPPQGPAAPGPGPGPQGPLAQGPSAQGPQPTGPGRLGTAALVTGALSLVLGWTIVGGVLLGTLALSLSARARVQANAAGRPSRQAVAGAVLGLLGLAAAGATYLWLQPHLSDYQGCRKASLSFADDRACREELRRSISG